MRILVADTETSGLSKSDGICQLAFTEINPQLEVISSWDSLIDPECPISASASGTNGITDDMVADAPTMAEAMELLEQQFGHFNDVLLIAHNCVTGDHEVRTPAGWVRLDRLKDGSEVMQWNPENQELTFVPAPVLRKPYDGPMLQWDTLFHKGIYTPEHRMLFKGRQGQAESWEFETAQALSKRGPNSLVIPVSGTYSPDKPLDISPREAQVMEMIRADANVQKSKNHYYARFRFKNPEKVSRCKALFEKLGINYNHTLRGGVDEVRNYRSPVVDKICSLLGVGKDKKYQDWVMTLTLPARRKLLEEVRHWDGSWTSSSEGQRQTTLHSAKAEDAYWVREMAVISGYNSVAKFDIPNEGKGFCKKGGLLHRVTIRPRMQVKTLEKPTEINFSGTVYCVTVPAGAFLVRRRGVTWVTGNCQFDRRMLNPYWGITSTLCTLKVARRLVPEAPDHKLQTLKFFLGLGNSIEGAHSATVDVADTLALLKCLIERSGMDLFDMMGWHLRPEKISIMPWGKHKDMALADLPASYRQWLLSLPDLSDDLRWSLTS